MCQSNLLFHSRDECIPSEENVFPGKRGPITNKAAPHSLPPSSLPPTRSVREGSRPQTRVKLAPRKSSSWPLNQVQIKFSIGRIKAQGECRRLSKSRLDAFSAPSRHLHQLKNILILRLCIFEGFARDRNQLTLDETRGDDLTSDRFLCKLRLDVQGKREEERPTPESRGACKEANNKWAKKHWKSRAEALRLCDPGI